METQTHEEENVSSIYTGIMPAAADTKAESSNSQDADEQAADALKKKYHSSAMYAASMWHNTVSHVRAHSHKATDM